MTVLARTVAEAVRSARGRHGVSVRGAFFGWERKSVGPVERLSSIERKRVAHLDQVATLEPSLVVAHPLPGKWSIREIIEHLVLAEREVVGDFSRLSDLVERPRTPENRIKYLVVMFVLRYGIPVRTPSTAMVPTGERSLAELRATWDEHHRLLRSFVGGLDRGGARRALFRHPIAGPITVSQGIRMLDVHLDTHIRQIRRLEQLLRGARTA